MRREVGKARARESLDGVKRGDAGVGDLVFAVALAHNPGDCGRRYLGAEAGRHRVNDVGQ